VRKAARRPRLAAAVLLLAAAARADVLHVPGEFPTIAFAVEAAGPGDTILIAAGTYDEQVVVNGAEGLVLRGQGKVVLTGGSGDVGVDLVNCVDTTVERLRFTGQTVGVRVTGGTGVTLERCRAEDMASQGFQVLDSQGTRVDRCLVDGALNQGLQLVGVVTRSSSTWAAPGSPWRGATTASATTRSSGRRARESPAGRTARATCSITSA
jgi:hypothetical protein